MKYTNQEHLALWKYSQKLESEGNHIYDVSEKVLDRPTKFFLELRKKYHSINETREFLERRWIFLEPNPKSTDLDNLISDIILLFLVT